jgi:hypothetical protein
VVGVLVQPTLDVNATPVVLRARKEVIVSAGSIGSPQLLMLSGIGPQSHLKALEIPLVADLPVGQNLQDHLSAWLSVRATRPVTITRPKLERWAVLARYLLTGCGPLARSVYQACAFFSTGLSTVVAPQKPDVQLNFLCAVVDRPFGLVAVFERCLYVKNFAWCVNVCVAAEKCGGLDLSGEWTNTDFSPDVAAFTILATLARPKRCFSRKKIICYVRSLFCSHLFHDQCW